MFTKAGRKRRAACTQAAFTVVEVCLAALLLGYFATASVYAMIHFNKVASVARFKTIASVAAQQKMDEIMTVSWKTTGTVPAVLKTGTPESIPLNNDAFNSASGLGSIYTNNDVQITATRTTVITAVKELDKVTGLQKTNPRLLSASVTVSYKYCNKDYAVTLYGVRATDNF